jgi:hypothetical protein
MNLYRGVDAVDGAALVLALDGERSCGQVTVQD